MAVDADEHIIEPHDLREKCLDPRYGNRALRLRDDESGLESLGLSGKWTLKIHGGRLGAFGTSGPSPKLNEAFETLEKAIWAGSTPSTLHKSTFLHKLSRRHT